MLKKLFCVCLWLCILSTTAHVGPTPETAAAHREPAAVAAVRGG